ncbi:N-formylglutamate deformylase [Phaeobacter sp.]|uniref:N-formylglutamate deformylase n=1 Tax=Phaeobacter sp. TaxID=1902409 RepID=UPI0025DF0D00|nr:N-formylglutamate deformylase [Phaeobacter sp.]
MQVFECIEGDSPLILGQSHGGTYVPTEIADRLNENGRQLADTDWHIAQLYDGLVEDVTIVRSHVHRYVVDANRDPAGVSLYPGQNTTTLVPQTDFDGRPMWQPGFEPNAAETATLCEAYHTPYHAALEAQIDRVKARHGFAILYDCHSIRGRIPFLFEGRLPDFSIGTNLGQTCDPALEQLVAQYCEQADGYTSVINGRFKGGWTTRHYGRPASGVHAIQMELAQATYCDEHPPWTYRPERADRLRQTLARILTDLQNWRPSA